jgi:hypothetical protein
LLADRSAARAGAAATARAGAVLAALGLAAPLALAAPLPTIIGFALMGFGLSAVFPLTLRASGFTGEAPAPSLAAVSTLGYTGFLVGPPVIGLLAEASDLRVALGLVCLLCLLAAALAASVRDE